MTQAHVNTAVATGGANLPMALERYTHAPTMQALLQTLLPGFANGRWRIEGVQIRSVLRNTSLQRNPCVMTLCYWLQVLEPSTGRKGTQCLYGQVFRGAGADGHDRAATALASPGHGAWVAPAFGQPWVHLPSLQLLLWALPNDPRLAQLPSLMKGTAPAFLAPHRRAGAAEVWQVEILRYTPQQRASLRYSLPASATRAAQVVYAKTFAGAVAHAGARADVAVDAAVDAGMDAAAIHQRFVYFWQLAQRDASAPLVAEPLGYDASTRTVWQAAAPGLPLLDVLTPANSATLMADVARALAHLHAAPLRHLPGAELHSVAHWLAEVQRRQNKIGRANPALSARVACIAETIRAHAKPVAQRPLSLIHGDWHPDQCWLHEGRIVLFDFDEFTLGDPMEDLAAFIVKLEQTEHGPACSAALVAQYPLAADATGATVAATKRFNAHSLAWHLTVQSLLQVTRTFIYQQPGWADLLESRLAATQTRATALCHFKSP
jgi:thiamine kinase-like enzyme